MIGTILTHKIRRDLLRQNKTINHRQYLHSLQPFPKIKYWAGYHKKKLVFFALAGVLSWHYDIHKQAYNYIRSIRSPKDFVSHLVLGTEKVEKTVIEQQVIGWTFSDAALQMLTKVYYETDKNLIFGLGRNYLYQVYSSMGLLQKKEEERQFWVNGGFYRKRNQLVSGVGYNQFMQLFQQAYKSLKKTNSSLTEEEFLQQFMELFIAKAPQIQRWQKQFDQQRHSQFLKSLLIDNDKKTDQICSLMKSDLEISEEEVENKLVAMGMKGMGVRDKWLYWRNREILYSLRQSGIHRRLNSAAVELSDRRDLQRKLALIQQQLSRIGKQKQNLKQKYNSLYAQELI